MGNVSSEPSGRLIVHVKTGDRKGAGTDATVRIIAYDTVGNKTEELKLSRFWRNDHERGHTDEFPIPDSHVPAQFGEIDKVEFWRDSFGIGDSWFLDCISVEDCNTKKVYHFPAQRWVNANIRYVVKHYDTCLPQYDEDPVQRLAALQEKRLRYQYVIHAPGMPAQVSRLPEDETFSDSYKWDIVTNKLQFMNDRRLISFTMGAARWNSWDDLKKVYKYSMELPLGAKYWNNDLWFGTQRVQGCNPVLIRLCRKIPPNVTISEGRIQSYLDGHSLSEALLSNRIFMVDLKILENLKCKNDRTVCAPLAFFYLDSDNSLLPLAIQLFQQPGPNNPVFYPSDNPYTWLLAKMWYNNADASYHQSCTHLGFTHLLMEGIAVCTHRHLSPSHPVFKLLAPHFLFLLAINTRGLQKLINPGGWVDKTTTVGRCGMFDLIARGLARWRLDVDAIPAAHCAERQVADPNILPNYPYRDDATAIYDAIKEYVATIIEHFYDTTKTIVNDYELQNWTAELVFNKSGGGVGIQGVPGNGVFRTTDEIITTISAIICTCSVAHAAANFNQYDEYGFPPNYPAFLSGKIPQQKVFGYVKKYAEWRTFMILPWSNQLLPKFFEWKRCAEGTLCLYIFPQEGYTDRDILAQLPSKSVTLDTMVVTRLLSSRGTKPLGDFEVQYLYDPVSLAAAAKFRQNLQDISQKIQARNRQSKTRFAYPWLDPQYVPNSISI